MSGERPQDALDASFEGGGDSIEQALAGALNTPGASPTTTPDLLEAFGERFSILGTLGRGGMGEVFEVQDSERQIRCALKVMTGERGQSVLRFKREFRTIAELRHPNLVRHFDLITSGDVWFYTMERVEGGDLRSVLIGDDDDGYAFTRTTLCGLSVELLPDFDDPEPEDEPSKLEAPACDLRSLLVLAAQILDALEFLHRRNIVHRDLKPSNIMVDPSGQVRLLDFGIAKAVGQHEHTGSTGAALGTLAYIAPEAAAGEEITAATDIYSLGCILFEMITGRPPFRGAPLKLLLAHQNEAAPSITSLTAGVPQALVDVCGRMLAKEPNQRPSIAEVRAALQLPEDVANLKLGELVTDEVFVGRDAELASLGEQLEAARGGAFQVAFISGESGSGKSALSRALMRRARDGGFAVFSGRCYEREALPFRAFDQVVDAMALAMSRWPKKRVARHRAALGDAVALFPALSLVFEAHQLPAPDSTSGADVMNVTAEGARGRAISGLLRLLGELQRQSPLLFVVDDLQWTDSESLELLESLVTASSAARVLVMCMYRSEDVGPGHVLLDFLSRHDGRESVRQLELGPLSDEEVALVLEHVVGERLGDAAVALVEQVHGNAFVGAQLAQLLLRPDVRERLLVSERLPSIGELLEIRFGELGEDARGVLDVAAASGGVSGRDLLRRASGLGQEALEVAIDALVHARMLKPVTTDGSSSGSAFDVYHDRLREHAYDALSPDGRRELHVRLADAVAAGDEDPEALLRHCQAAELHERAQQARIRAAEQALSQMAFARAAVLYRAAVDYSKDHDGDVAERAMLAIGAAAAHGAMRSYKDVVELREYAHELLASIDPESLDPELARRSLENTSQLAFYLTLASGEYARGYVLLDEVANRLGWRFTRPYGQHLRTIGVLQLRQWMWKRVPEAWGRRPPKPDDLTTLAILRDLALAATCSSFLSAGEATLRLELFTRRIEDLSLVINTEISHSYVETLMRGFSARRLDRRLSRLDRLEGELGDEPAFLSRASLDLARGVAMLERDIERSAQCFLSCSKTIERAGLDAVGVGELANGWLGLAYEMLGRYDDAVQVTTYAYDSTAPGLDIFTHCTWVRCALRRGDVALADAALENWGPLSTEGMISLADFYKSCAHQWVDAAKGRYAEVLERESLQREQVRQFGAPLVVFPWSSWIQSLVDASVALHEASEASPAVQTRGRKLARWLSRKGWLANRSLGHRFLARFAAADGKDARARSHIEDALTECERLGDPYNRWLCLLTAIDVGAGSDERVAEADELKTRFGFVRLAN